MHFYFRSSRDTVPLTSIKILPGEERAKLETRLMEALCV